MDFILCRFDRRFCIVLFDQWRSVLRQIKRYTVVCTILSLISSFPALAQSSPWGFEASSYIWLPESTTGIKTEAGNVDSELSVSDALDQLDVGIMLTGVAQRDRWSLVGDLVYLNLEAEENTPFGQLYSKLESDTTLFILNGYVFYQIYHPSDVGVGLGVGARAVDSSVETTLRPGLLPAGSDKVSDDWVDPVLAFRLLGQVSKSWSASLTLDFGGFGSVNASDSTWQGVALIAYQLTDSWLLRGGYRHLYIDREADGQSYDFEMSGALFGVSFRF